MCRDTQPQVGRSTVGVSTDSVALKFLWRLVSHFSRSLLSPSAPECQASPLETVSPSATSVFFPISNNTMSAIVQRIEDAYVGVTNPRAIDSTHFVDCTIVTGVAFALIGLFHFLVASKFKKPYFVCHVAVNAVITAIVFQGSVRSLLNPTASTVPLSSESANSHLYVARRSDSRV